MNKKNVLNLLGKMPSKTNPNLTILESVDKGDYLIKTVIYNVEKNEKIKAFLLIPKNNLKKMPGVLALHQHACEYNLGKSETAGREGNKMYSYGLELCLRGYVVLCPDHLCFEDRQDPKMEGMWFERFKFMEYLLNGSTLQAKYISDILQAIRVLKSLKEVDKKNLGIIGHSLGGQEVMWSMIFDKDLKAGICSAGFSQMKCIFEDKINHSFSTFIPNLIKKGDLEDVVPLIAPKKFLIIAGEKDHIFPIRGVKQIEKKLRIKYSQKNSQNNLKVIYHKKGHEFPEEIRKKAYCWLDQHLQKIK